MGLFKSKAEKKSKRIRKMLGSKPLRIHLDSSKKEVRINFSVFPISEIENYTVDYEFVDTFCKEDVSYDYDFWKGYAYSHMSESHWGWLLGIDEYVHTTNIGVYRVYLRVNCFNQHLTETFSAGVFLENDPALEATYQNIWNQCADLILKTEKIKREDKKNNDRRYVEDTSSICLKDDAYKVRNSYERLLEGMDVTLAQINKELNELSTAMSNEQKELELKIKQINSMIDQYNELSQRKLDLIKKTGIKLQELLNHDAQELSFEGKKATYVIEAGNYIVGEDIEAGKYHYVVVCGHSYTKVTAMDGSLLVNAVADATKRPWVYRNLRLKNGDVLVLDDAEAKGLLIRV